MSRSPNKELVETYLDGFRTNDHRKILSCLAEDIGPPRLEVVRMVEEGDTVMAELRGWAPQEAGEPVRMSMAEVFVIRDGKIAERRAWVIPLVENEYR